VPLQVMTAGFQCGDNATLDQLNSAQGLSQNMTHGQEHLLIIQK